MNNQIKYLLIISGCTIGLPVFANSDTALDLPSYYARPAPPAPVTQRLSQNFDWLHNFYLNANYGRAFTKISDLTVSPNTTDVFVGPLNSDNINENVNQLSVGLGYQFKPSGIFSRFEIVYTNRGNISYNSPNLFAFPSESGINTSLNSSIKNQTLLVNTFYDIDFGSPFIPYLQLGAGVSRNKINGSSTSTFTFEGKVFNSNTNNFDFTNTNFAWDAGLGIRLKLNTHVYLNAGYEFDWLGKTHWSALVAPDPAIPPSEIDSDKFFSNTVLLGITIKG